MQLASPLPMFAASTTYGCRCARRGRSQCSSTAPPVSSMGMAPSCPRPRRCAHAKPRPCGYSLDHAVTASTMRLQPRPCGYSFAFGLRPCGYSLHHTCSDSLLYPWLQPPLAMVTGAHAKPRVPARAGVAQLGGRRARAEAAATCARRPGCSAAAFHRRGSERHGAQ